MRIKSSDIIHHWQNLYFCSQIIQPCVYSNCGNKKVNALQSVHVLNISSENTRPPRLLPRTVLGNLLGKKSQWGKTLRWPGAAWQRSVCTCHHYSILAHLWTTFLEDCYLYRRDDAGSIKGQKILKVEPWPLFSCLPLSLNQVFSLLLNVQALQRSAAAVHTPTLGTCLLCTTVNVCWALRLVWIRPFMSTCDLTLSCANLT